MKNNLPVGIPINILMKLFIYSFSLKKLKKV